MEHVTATILDGKKVLAKDILAWFQAAPDGEAPAWSGGFDLRPGAQAATGKPYLLKAADGRSGEFVIKRISYHSNGAMRVECEGSKPLA